MTALREEGNHILTTNGAPAFASTLNPSLDLFSVPPNASGRTLHDLLNKSWEHDPDLSLRLIFNLRSIHEGKSEKDSFYHAFGWLFEKHPKTAILNLQQLVEPVIERAAKKPKKDASTEDSGGPMDEDEEWTDVGESGEKKVKEPKKDFRMGYAHGYYKGLLSLYLSLIMTKFMSSIHRPA